MNRKADIRSMTGFAQKRQDLGHGQLTVSVKSVNHRGLDVHVYAPPAFDVYENATRAAVKKSVTRGHVDVRVNWTPAGDSKPAGFNRELLAAYLSAFREASAQYGLGGLPDLNCALQLEGMFQGGDAPPQDALPSEERFLAVLGDALQELNAFRSREGAELATEIERLNGEIAAGCKRMQELRTGAAAAFRERLESRLKEHLSTTLDPARLAQEAALLADRSEIAEELTRLEIHSRQMSELTKAGGETGKKLDFLLQEMNRETNTVVSKTAGIGEAGLEITDVALAVKAAIEKIREQASNLE